jgi:hypothetical protein
MSTGDVIDPTDQYNSVRVTVTTIEIPTTAAQHQIIADEVRRAIAPIVGRDAHAYAPTQRPRPVRDALRRWSPFRPFAGLLTSYRLAAEALGRNGKLGVIYICIVAGLASIIWRHFTVPIGIAGGLLVSGILLVRTGAYREYLAALEDTHGVPPLDVVVSYNVHYLMQRIRVLWRRH